jgi:asparagine synthase (glutamine-hydrolysing)
MCGIVGFYSNESPISLNQLDRATSALHHRGPDQQKLWLADHGRAGLGHSRLSIIDMESGDQPIASEDGNVRVVVNGEFYDYVRIQKELQLQGHIFSSKSDSETIVHLYEEYSIDCLEHLRGEFAFVLWDERKQRMFAVRDRFGIKPLFYSIKDNQLFLASEMKALFSAGIPAEWDKTSYYQHLFLCLEQDKTLFKNIGQVPPGHYLLADHNGVRIQKYWDMNYPTQDETSLNKSEEEYIEQIRYELEEAIKIRMVADVPICYYLSGGLDSSAVLGIAMNLQSENTHAFNVTFNHEAYDEGKIAQATAKHVGAEYIPISLSQTDFANHIEKAVWHAETIGTNSHGVARYLQSLAVHQKGHRVVLSGDGADELFGGYIYFKLDSILANEDGLSERLQQKRLEELIQNNPAFRKVLSPLIGSNTNQYTTITRGYIPVWIKAMELSRAPLKAVLSTDFASSFNDYNPVQLFTGNLDDNQIRNRSLFHQSMYLWNKSILPNQILFSDRMDMAHGVEVRMPLLDHKLFETIRTVPTSMLIRGMQEKYIFRESVKSYVTDTVYKRRKHPFTAPHSTLDISSPLYERIQDTLRSDIVKEIPFFNAHAVKALMDHLPKLDYQARISLDPAILIMYSTCVLHKNYIKQQT